MKIASMKNAKPFERERQADDRRRPAHELGHSRPSSNESIVPETAPTANRIAIALRPGARELVVGAVARAQPQPFGDEDQQRQADAERGEDEVERQRRPHLRAGGDQVVHSS